MTRLLKRGAATLTAIVLPSIVMAQASPGENGTYLIRGGTVVTGTGEKLANTNILVRNGRIAQMGTNVTANDAKVIDAAGKFVYPGMIDANTGIGLQEIGGVQTMTCAARWGSSIRIRALVGLNVERDPRCHADEWRDVGITSPPVDRSAVRPR
jgi:hypothetical protein